MGIAPSRRQPDWRRVPRRLGLGARLLVGDLRRLLGPRALAAGGVAIAALVVIPVIGGAMTQSTLAQRDEVRTIPVPEAPINSGEATDDPAPVREWRSLTVKSGQSLATLLKTVGLGPRVVHDLVRLDEHTARLKRIFPGQILLVDAVDGQLNGLEFELDESRRVRVERGPDGLSSRVLQTSLERRIVQKEGVIEDSLFLSAQRAGMSDAVIMGIATIFGWDIDFVLDIRRGDRFAVIYEDIYRNGEKLRTGDILAATFVNRGKVFNALRYVTSEGRPGYYSPEGRNMRKAFLRSPLDVTRITSRFTMKRYHPVLKINRPHRGVDYGAGVGTPVRATGDGKVILAGKARGYGNHVIIQHANQYKTLYAHLSRFAKGVRKGSRVRQGQVIAYSGRTGLVSGPHLHYEFRVNNKHVDPLRMKFPAAKPLAGKEMARFKTTLRPLMAQLDMFESRLVAAAP